MTNNNDTITLNSDTHGLFLVRTEHLAMTMQGHSGWMLEQLIDKVHTLTGDLADYTDLTYPEAMILISYLTGGSPD